MRPGLQPGPIFQEADHIVQRKLPGPKFEDELEVVLL